MMKQSEIDKLVENAKFTVVDDDSAINLRAEIKKLDATFDFPTENEEQAREQLGGMIESVLRVRGVEITE